MPMGYRSFLNVDPGHSLLSTVIDHINVWSGSKGISIDASLPGRHTPDPGNVITVRRGEISGAQVYRWRRERQHVRWPGQMWRTTVTALERPGAAAWLWTEIESYSMDPTETWSPTAFMSVPSVVRSLLEVLPCRDGRSVMAPGPRWVSVDDLPDMMDYLADDLRRGPIFVVSEHVPHLAYDKLWATEVMWDVVGLGTVFVLGPGVDREFNDMVGRDHAVPVGTMRTYLPNVNLDDPHDPARHLTMSRVRIDSSNPRRLSRMLGLVHRERMARSRAAFLSADALNVDRALSLRDNAAVAA